MLIPTSSFDDGNRLSCVAFSRLCIMGYVKMRALAETLKELKREASLSFSLRQRLVCNYKADQ